MKKRLIIHGGMHKCGSSALQLFLYNNKDALLEQGVLYPEIGMDFDAEIGFRHLYVRESLFGTSSSVSNVWKKIHEEAEKKHINTIILSHENFLSPGGFSSESASELNSLFDIEMICYIPNPICYFNSKYKEWVRRVNFNGEPSDFVLSRFQYLHVDKLLDKWEKAFTTIKITCMPFDRSSLINNSIIDDFLFRTKLSFITNQSDKNVGINKSLNNKQVMAHLILNQCFGGVGELSGEQVTLFHHYVKGLVCSNNILIPHATCVTIKAMSWSTLQALRKKYQCDLPNVVVGDLVFDKKFSDLDTRKLLKDELESLLFPFPKNLLFNRLKSILRSFRK